MDTLSIVLPYSFVQKRVTLNWREISYAIETIQEKWAYLVLAWVYEHRNDYSEPLAVVEEVYAYFDYPEKISAFVRYMPSEAADLGSLELNIARLYERWEAYLKEEAKEYESNKQNQGHF